MSQLIERYVDMLIHDPNSPPPQGMDAETAAFVRALVAAGTVKPPEARRRRMWQRSLDSAKTASRAHSQRLTFTPSSNGHQVRRSDSEGDDPMAQMTFPAHRRAQTASSPQRMGVLTLVAAVALVIFGVILLTSIRSGSPMVNAPQGDDPAGSLLQGATETPTAVPTSTPLPPTVTPMFAEYVIQPGDTLLSILQQFNIEDFAAIRQIMALNNFDEIDQLPSPGTTIRLPLPTPSAESRPLSGAEATALPPTVVPPAAATVTATPIPVTGSSTGTYPMVATSTPVPLHINGSRDMTFASAVTFHVVAHGDTVASIASRYDTTLEMLAELNPQLDFSGCDLTRLSGGKHCDVLLRVGDEIAVPLYSEESAEGTGNPPTTVFVDGMPDTAATATPLELLPQASTATPLPTLVPR
jgi:LysM repeat protein